MQPTPYEPPQYVYPRRRPPCLVPFTGCLLGLGMLLLCVVAMPAACLMVLGLSNPEPLDADFTASQSEANQYENSFEQAVNQGNNSGTFVLTVQEEEMASWLTLEYERLREENELDSDFGWLSEQWQELEDLEFQVAFEEREFKFYTALSFPLNAEIGVLITGTLSPNQNSASRAQPLNVDITEFQIGSLYLPDSARRDVAADISEIITDELTFERFYRITDVSLENGQMELRGTVNR